jgi:hypothetical protein
LRSIAAYFKFPYNPDPHFPAQPIQVSREEFDLACEELAGQGVPLKADREQAWRDFAGWRVNYDTLLVALAAITTAPPSPWTGERGYTSLRRMEDARRIEDQRQVEDNNGIQSSL